jgi:hypothetical protein
LNTFWVFPDSADRFGRIGELIVSAEERFLKQNRLEQWIADLLLRRLREIVARRMTLNKGRAITGSSQKSPNVTNKVGSIPLDEVVEVITIPAFDTNAVSSIDPTSVEIPAMVCGIGSSFCILLFLLLFYLVLPPKRPVAGFVFTFAGLLYISMSQRLNNRSLHSSRTMFPAWPGDIKTMHSIVSSMLVTVSCFWKSAVSFT